MQDFLTALAAGEAASIALSQNGLRFIPGDDTLVVTFLSFAGKLDAEELSPLAVWGEQFLRRRGFSVLGINRQVNNWYRAHDLHLLLRALQRREFFSRYRRVMFYGGSMGGYAALAFAELAPGCIVLAHNPQSTLKTEAVPWETRFHEARKHDWSGDFGDGAIGARAAARVYVSYDPFLVNDTRHVERLAGSNLIRLRVPMVGHQVPVWLTEMGLLGKVFDQALQGDLSAAGFRLLARARFELPHYLISLAQRSRNPALKEYLGTKARAIAPANAEARTFLWSLSLPATKAAPFRPTIIWTVPGCMGNELLAWLRTQRPDLRMADRPFNGPGRSHSLSTLFNKLSHRPMVCDEIDRILSHCNAVLHEIGPTLTAFDLALLDAARDRHCDMLLLHRRSALDRCVILADSAPQFGATALPWLRQLTVQAWQAWTAMSYLEAAMQAHADTCRRLACEVFDPSNAMPKDRETLEVLLRDWGIDTHAAWPAAMDISAVAASYPPALKLALSWVPTLDEGQAFLNGELSSTQQPAIALDQLPPAIRAGDSVRISGLAVPPAGTARPDALLLIQSAARLDTRWGQDSPGGLHRYPGHADAARARFGPVAVAVDAERGLSLAWCHEDGTVSQAAKLKFRPLAGQRQRIEGLFLAPWSIGFRPLAGVASLEISQALRLAMHRHFGVPVVIQKPGALQIAQHRENLCDISGARFKFAVLRHPVDRFVSLWKRHGEPLGLCEQGLAAFIERFDEHLSLPALRDRFRSQVGLLGPFEQFDRLYRLDHLGRLRDDLKKLTGLDTGLQHRLSTEAPQESAPPGAAPKVPVPEPTPEDKRWIAERYAHDLALWECLQAT